MSFKFSLIFIITKETSKTHSHNQRLLSFLTDPERPRLVFKNIFTSTIPVGLGTVHISIEEIAEKKPVNIQTDSYVNVQHWLQSIH